MLSVPISNGELIDKITILLIKKERIHNEEKLIHVANELAVLEPLQEKIVNDENVCKLKNQLKNINMQLWDVEDELRDKERKKEFDTTFIELARKVYFTNDKRSQVKLEINKLSNSELVEVKSYEKY